MGPIDYGCVKLLEKCTNPTHLGIPVTATVATGPLRAATAAGGRAESADDGSSAPAAGSGSSLEDFEIEDRLGKGAYGVVHRVRTCVEI